MLSVERGLGWQGFALDRDRVRVELCGRGAEVVSTSYTNLVFRAPALKTLDEISTLYLGARQNVLGWAVAPFGFYKLLRWVDTRYRPAGGIVVTESGLPLREAQPEQAQRDAPRICYIKTYLAQLARAMKAGVDVRGYFVWTLMDNFEWEKGFDARFGLVHVEWSHWPLP